MGAVNILSFLCSLTSRSYTSVDYSQGTAANILPYRMESTAITESKTNGNAVINKIRLEKKPLPVKKQKANIAVSARAAPCESYAPTSGFTWLSNALFIVTRE